LEDTVAGYHVHSLDAKKFHQFVEKPTKSQLAAFADALADSLEAYDYRLEDDDPMKDWPVAPKDLVEIARQRLSLPDWYSDLSDGGKFVIENSVVRFVHTQEKDLGRHYELNDSIYWDLIDAALSHYGIRSGAHTEQVVSQFGRRPFGYHPQIGFRPGMDDYNPNHSMHGPEEVRRLLEELNAAEPTIRTSDGASLAFEELMPALERIVGKGRMLYVEVDT
jgi:hypothetical protein